MNIEIHQAKKPEMPVSEQMLEEVLISKRHPRGQKFAEPQSDIITIQLYHPPNPSLLFFGHKM